MTTPPAGEPTRCEDIAQALEWLLYSSDPVAHKVERLIVEQQREIEAMRKAVTIMVTWWDSQKITRMKSDYLKGHLSYVNQLEEMERAIIDVLDAARSGKAG
jgi:phage terminase large subunit-like protein